MNFQAMVDGMAAEWQKERAETQMTLGKLIDRLEQLPPDMEVDGLHQPDSYRGHYNDLAFERCDKLPASQLLATCRACMGEVFEGYKGGEFQMGRNTPLWVASYGCCGDRIMSLSDDGTLVTAPNED